MTTFKQYRQNCLHASQDLHLPFSVCTTSVQGAAGGATIVDLAHLGDNRSDADATRYEDMWINLLAGGYTNQTLNEARQVGVYAPATGTLTPTAVFGTGALPVLTAKEFELHKYGPPEALERAINFAFRQLRYKALTPLTLITDGDMELSVTTSWTASNTAHTKVTTAGYVWSGLRASKCANTLANGYIQSGSVAVPEGEPYLVAAIGQVASGTAKLVAWDVTHGLEIDSWLCPERDFFEFREAITIPSGCRLVALRLQGVEASADVYWDCAVLLPQNGVIFDAPSWLTKEEHLQGIVYFPASGALTSGDGRSVRNQEPQRWQGYDLLPDEMGAHAWRIRLRPSPGSNVPWLVAYRPHAELSADADTSTADIDQVTEMALAEYFFRLGISGEATRWRDRIKPQRPTIAWEGAYG